MDELRFGLLSHVSKGVVWGIDIVAGGDDFWLAKVHLALLFDEVVATRFVVGLRRGGVWLFTVGEEVVCLHLNVLLLRQAETHWLPRFGRILTLS
jgi:hypothetical protein